MELFNSRPKYWQQNLCCPLFKEKNTFEITYTGDDLIFNVQQSA